MKIQHELLPMRDYHMAKDLLWDPRAIALSQDREEWKQRTDDERDSTLTLISLFHAGEEAVTHDLTPLLMALRREGGHLEEQMFLTTQLFEEAKHFEFFDRWFDEVIGSAVDVDQRLGPAYRELFYHDLPAAFERLSSDRSRVALAEAVVTYHMVIEGVLAETGYHSVFENLQEQQALMGLVAGLGFIKRDEARHIAFGVYLLQRLVREEPALWDVIDAKMNALLPKALGVVHESLARFGDNIPYGIDLNELLAFAVSQYTARLNAIQRAVTSSERVTVDAM
ncbi:MAG: R2-like ligand-binding oxidase [Chloroflexi bacterium]|nr:MAG: R2-like ligand-binding oxidase [Chloroflexota bacterium]